MDIAVKIEFILADLISILFWSSITEFLIFVVLLLFFFVDAAEMGRVWFIVHHLIRATMGYFIIRNLPRTHDIIKNADIQPDEKMSFDMMFESLTLAARDALNHFTANTKKFLFTYFGVSVLCIAIDLIMTFSSISHFDEGDSSSADISNFVGATSLLFVDIAYIIWLNSLFERVPDYISSAISQMMFGSLDYVYL